MIRKSRIAAAFTALLLVCITGVRGQEVTTVDFRADVMSSIKIADSTALCLVGRVVFFHNGAVITCDSAIRYSDRMMDCYRNVVVNKDSTFIYGDKADYNGLLNEARIYSPLIKMVDKDATLYTYNFTFNTLTNIGHYYGGGTMSQKDNLMESDEGYYYADNRELIGVRNVEMQNPQYTISSDSVTYNMDTEIATFDTPSYIWNDRDEFLTARRGNYDSKEDIYTFTDSSYIMTKTQELWADTIVYRQTVQDAVLRNNIQIADQEQKAMAFGDYGQYWGDRKQALLTRDPSVLSYEEGEKPDTVFMRSDSIFIYTLNRFRNDSVASPETADSLAAGTSAPQPAADSGAVRPVMNGPGRPPVPTLPGGQAAPPASAPAPTPVPAGNDTETPADSTQQNSPGAAADSLVQSQAPVSDSVSAADSARKVKERPVDPKKLEKERLRKEKEEARTVKIKAKIKASREKAAAIARAQQEQEWARQRKELARRFLKGKATPEDTLALLKLDSLQQVFAADTLASSPDSTAQKAPPPAVATDSSAMKAAVDSATVVDPADSLVRIVRGYYNVRIYRSDFQAVCDSIVGFSIDSTIHMYIDPVLWNGENQITAQTVDIFTKNQTIEKAVFKGEPLMCSRVDSTHFNQVKGKVIETYFNNGEIFKTDVNGNGQTYYYMEDGDSTDRYISGFLVAECADITFRFSERQVNEIVYRGNPSYSIYPMDKIPETQSQLMKGFKWEIERKPTKEQVFTRTIRPSQRARYETLSKPTYPITGRIDRQREELPKSGWIDRTDRYLSQEALEFVQSLGN